MRVNSINNNKTTFGMAFKMTESAAKMVENLLGENRLNLQKTINGLGYLQARYGEDIVDLSLSSQGNKISVRMSDPRAIVEKNFSPKNIFEKGEKTSEKMLKKLNLLKKKQAVDDGARFSGEILEKNYDAIKEAKKQANSEFLGSLIK